jgi:hypothetical protein
MWLETTRRGTVSWPYRFAKPAGTKNYVEVDREMYRGCEARIGMIGRMCVWSGRGGRCRYDDFPELIGCYQPGQCASDGICGASSMNSWNPNLRFEEKFRELSYLVFASIFVFSCAPRLISTHSKHLLMVSYLLALRLRPCLQPFSFRLISCHALILRPIIFIHYFDWHNRRRPRSPHWALSQHLQLPGPTII